MSDTEDLHKIQHETVIYIPQWMYQVPLEWRQFYFDEIAGIYAVSMRWGNA